MPSNNKHEQYELFLVALNEIQSKRYESILEAVRDMECFKSAFREYVRKYTLTLQRCEKNIWKISVN